MTLGQVYVHFDGLAEYLKMTSPWGSGDGDTTSSNGHKNGKRKKHYEDLDAAQRIVGKGFAHPAMDIKHISELEPEFNDIVLPLLEDD
jgi:hypothetical protein